MSAGGSGSVQSVCAWLACTCRPHLGQLGVEVPGQRLRCGNGEALRSVLPPELQLRAGGHCRLHPDQAKGQLRWPAGVGRDTGPGCPVILRVLGGLWHQLFPTIGKLSETTYVLG